MAQRNEWMMIFDKVLEYIKKELCIYIYPKTIVNWEPNALI